MTSGPESEASADVAAVSVAAGSAGVPRNTVRTWMREGFIDPVGEARGPRGTYALVSLKAVEVEAAWRRDAVGLRAATRLYSWTRDELIAACESGELPYRRRGSEQSPRYEIHRPTLDRLARPTVTLEQARRRLGESRDRVLKRCKEEGELQAGELPCRRFGSNGYFQIDAEAVERLATELERERKTTVTFAQAEREWAALTEEALSEWEAAGELRRRIGLSGQRVVNREDIERLLERYNAAPTRCEGCGQPIEKPGQRRHRACGRSYMRALASRRLEQERRPGESTVEEVVAGLSAEGAGRVHPSTITVLASGLGLGRPVGARILFSRDEARTIRDRIVDRREAFREEVAAEKRAGGLVDLTDIGQRIDRSEQQVLYWAQRLGVGRRVTRRRLGRAPDTWLFTEEEAQAVECHIREHTFKPARLARITGKRSHYGRASKALAAERGTVVGRPRALTEGQERTARALRDHGASVRAIASELGCGVATIHRLLAAEGSGVPEPLSAVPKP